jgi:predicted  nucleic acid-binding Zn-ribbon protein
VSSSLATASSELESLRSAHQNLESKLKEVEEKRELAEKQLSEKNSEFIKEKVDLVEKRKKDSLTLKSLQENVQHLQTYMRMAEQGWDLLNSDIMGRYPEPQNQISSP